VLVDGLAGVSIRTRREQLIDFIHNEVADVMGQDRNKPIALETGLFEMGMDSLMSVELQHRLERGIGRSLPSTLTFNYPSVSLLATFVERLLWGAGAMEPVLHLRIAPEQATSLDEMTDAELEARLITRLEEIG
jgi:acyl carrier protein